MRPTCAREAVASVARVAHTLVGADRVDAGGVRSARVLVQRTLVTV